MAQETFKASIVDNTSGAGYMLQRTFDGAVLTDDEGKPICIAPEGHTLGGIVDVTFDKVSGLIETKPANGEYDLKEFSLD